METGAEILLWGKMGEVEGAKVIIHVEPDGEAVHKGAIRL